MARNPVIQEIRRQAAAIPGRRRRRVIEASAYETGRIESNFTELPGGDADSENWRQERASVYGPAWKRSGGALNTRASVARYLQEAQRLYHGQPSYKLAADVQRPAAQYRGRYRTAQAEALRLLGGSPARAGTPGRAVPPRSTSGGTRQVATFDQAGYDQAVRRQRLATFLQHSGRGNSVLFRTGLLSSRPVDQSGFEGTRTVQLPGGVPATRSIASQSEPAHGQVDSAVKAARHRLGVHENAGTNRSPTVDQLERGFGMLAQPWCGIFVGTALREAGVKGVDSRVASVAEIERMARSRQGAFAGGFHASAHARRGDALITVRGGHVALVTKVDRDRAGRVIRIHTIGGNQGAGDVSRRTYTPEQVYGAARPRYHH